MSVRVLTISAKFKLDRDFKQKLDLEVTVFDKIIKVNRHFFVMFVSNFLDIAQDKKRLDKTFCSTGSSYQRDHAVLVNNDNSQPNVSRSKKYEPFPWKSF